MQDLSSKFAGNKHLLKAFEKGARQLIFLICHDQLNRFRFIQSVMNFLEKSQLWETILPFKAFGG